MYTTNNFTKLPTVIMFSWHFKLDFFGLAVYLLFN